jgi:hypothetical protein
VNDLIGGKPILSQLSTAVTTGDEHAIEDVQTKSGYNTTPEGVSKVLQTASPGPSFDIRMGKSSSSSSTPT